MVEDRGGLGYKFQSAGRRKSRDGSDCAVRAKLDELVKFSKEVCNFIFEKRWWIILSTGISLIILSVKDQIQTPSNVNMLYSRDLC